MTIAADPEDVRLLKNPRFRRLLESRILGQTSQYAMFYALLILIVEETGSSVQTTLLVVAVTLPSIILGIPCGALADILPRRFTLTAGNLLRAILTATLIVYEHNTVLIFLLVAAYSTAGALFSPAESATVPAVVRRDQLPAANALMVFTLIVGQVLGMVAMAPLLLRLAGPTAVFAVATLLMLAATFVIGWLGSGFSPAEEAKTRSLGFLEAMDEGFRILRRDRRAYLAIVYLTTTLALSKVLVVLLPKYTESVLHIAAEDTVFVVAPGAIGAALGLLLAPLLIRPFGAWRVVVGGLALFLLGLAGLGLVVYVRDFIESHLDLGISFVERSVGVSSVITVTMLLAIPLGFAFSLVSVAGRVVMNEQAPAEAQGRVFAVQGSIGDFLSLLPLLIVGVVSDLVGVRATLLAAVLSAMTVAAYLTFSRRFGPSPGPPEPALEAAPQAG